MIVLAAKFGSRRLEMPPKISGYEQFFGQDVRLELRFRSGPLRASSRKGPMPSFEYFVMVRSPFEAELGGSGAPRASADFVSNFKVDYFFRQKQSGGGGVIA